MPGASAFAGPDARRAGGGQRAPELTPAQSSAASVARRPARPSFRYEKKRSRRQPVHIRGLRIAPGGTQPPPADRRWPPTGPATSDPRDPSGPGAAGRTQRSHADGNAAAERSDHGLVDLVAAGADGRPDRGPEPVRPRARPLDERRDERSAIPARCRASPRAPSRGPAPRVDDDQRHAVGGEDRQRRARRRVNRASPVPTRPPAPAASASRQTSPWTCRAYLTLGGSSRGPQGGPPSPTPERPGRRRDGVEAPLLARRERVPQADLLEGRERGVRGRLPVPADHGSIPPPAPAPRARRGGGEEGSLTVSRPAAGGTRGCRDRRHSLEPVRAHAIRPRPPPRRRPLAPRYAFRSTVRAPGGAPAPAPAAETRARRWPARRRTRSR